jgi:hypothetical protein
MSDGALGPHPQPRLDINQEDEYVTDPNDITNDITGNDSTGPTYS